MLGKKRIPPTIESKQDKFLLKLYEILSKEEYSKIIHWSQNGSYIIITNIHLLAKICQFISIIRIILPLFAS